MIADDIDLESYFKINTSLIVNQHCSLSEIENLMPWERDIYLALINNYIEERNKQMNESNG